MEHSLGKCRESGSGSQCLLFERHVDDSLKNVIKKRALRSLYNVILLIRNPFYAAASPTTDLKQLWLRNKVRPETHLCHVDTLLH